jgi:N-acetyl-beta-hexosaminidase
MPDMSSCNLIFVNSSEKKAAELFRAEMSNRVLFPVSADNYTCNIIFKQNDSISDCNDYSILINDDTVTVEARGIRGFIYAIGMLLRKIEFTRNSIKLIEDVSGYYSPYMKIRGH